MPFSNKLTCVLSEPSVPSHKLELYADHIGTRDAKLRNVITKQIVCHLVYLCEHSAEQLVIRQKNGRPTKTCATNSFFLHVSWNLNFLCHNNPPQKWWTHTQIFAYICI